MNPEKTINLAGIDELRKLLKSLATLDLIMSPEWESRYYSFNSKWDVNEQMGSMRNGMGDEFIAWFTNVGCFIKGFDHESEMSSWSTPDQQPWPNMYTGIPEALNMALNEPAFSMENVSFCYWRLNGEAVWSRGELELPKTEDPDGAEYLLALLDGKPGSYQDFAEEYYEQDIPLSPIRDIYAHKSITSKTIELLNPDVTIESIASELEEIGYPEPKI